MLPAWAGSEAGRVAERPGLHPSLGWAQGRLGAREEQPSARPRPSSRPVSRDRNHDDDAGERHGGGTRPAREGEGKDGCLSTSFSPRTSTGQRGRRGRRDGDGIGRRRSGRPRGRRAQAAKRRLPSTIPSTEVERTTRRSFLSALIYAGRLQTTATSSAASAAMAARVKRKKGRGEGAVATGVGSSGSGSLLPCSRRQGRVRRVRGERGSAAQFGGSGAPGHYRGRGKRFGQLGPWHFLNHHG